MDYTGTYTGLLSSVHAQDAMRVSLTIEGDILHAIEETGAAWDIALDRVELIRWSERELELELAGEAVAFVPEDPDSVLQQLVPALLADDRKGVPTAAGGPSTPLASDEVPASRGLIVDLTDPDSEPSPMPVAQAPISSDTGPRPPSASWSADSAPAPAFRRARRRSRRRVLVSALIALVVAVAALVALSLRSGADPEQQARAALEAAGLPAVSVAVDGGTATLSGTVDSASESQAALRAVGDIAGIDDIANQIEVATPGPPTDPPTSAPPPEEPPTLITDAEAALSAVGIDSVVVQTEGGLVVVSGSVASEADRRAVLAALFGVDGIEQVDNRMTVASVPDETVAASARTALDEAGFEAVAVVVEEGVATLTGVVPLEVLDRGFFQYSDRAEDTVATQEGVQGIRNRLQLTGDAATLRDQLRSLTESAPITFALGGSSLNATSRATLDTASGIIQAQPGLRVLIAGHTDTIGSAAFNEQLSQERADAVRQYLIDRGIAANRLVVVAYGELFPSTPGAEPLDRRVEFEVAG